MQKIIKHLIELGLLKICPHADKKEDQREDKKEKVNNG